MATQPGQFESESEEPAEEYAWTDQGVFFADRAEGGDPVQGNIGNCYFISAMAAVAWSIPAFIRWRAPGAVIIGAGDADTGSLRFSPGWYHRGDFDRRGIVVTDGPLWQRVTTSELLPTTADGVPPYARSSDAGETWPGIYEKTFAVWRSQGAVRGIAYELLGGGDCGEATRALVGRDWVLDRFSLADETPTSILEIVKSHSRTGKTFHPMTVWTYGIPEDLPDDVEEARTQRFDRADIAPNHCYTVLGWAGSNIILRNPWGFQGAAEGYRAEIDQALGLRMNENGVFAMPSRRLRSFFEGLCVAYPD
jgi:hypothetical protein